MTQEQAYFIVHAASDEFFHAAMDASCGPGSVGDYHDRMLAYMAGGEL